MKLAILFWFYKDIEVCKNRLQLIRKYNPNIKIYGLYGGPSQNSDEFKSGLMEYMDDFFLSPFLDPDWKWYNGDLVILDWYEKRGKVLEWDSIIPVQWDMLVFDSLEKIFSGIKEDEMYISGLQKISSFIEKRWHWTKKSFFGSRERKNYLSFKKYIKENYNYDEDLLCCLFILLVIPRKFFDKYLTVENREVGFLEYKIPTYAKIFDFKFFEKDLSVEFSFKKEDRGNKAMNAIPIEINDSYIDSELKKRDGWRIFHPYFNLWRDK
jgi:hypothetical protein